MNNAQRTAALKHFIGAYRHIFRLPAKMVADHVFADIPAGEARYTAAVDFFKAAAAKRLVRVETHDTDTAEGVMFLRAA